MPSLLVVIASTRPGRVGQPVGEWFAQAAKEHGGFDVSVADLAVLDLPMMDEPKHPRLGEYTQQHTKDWSAIVKASDAVVFVMPEYNFAFNAPLKNAIDFLFNEWAYLPVGFVSYGGMSGGIRAVQMIKQVAVALKMVPSGPTVAIPMVFESIADDAFKPSDIVSESATAMLDELGQLATALSDLRKPEL